MTKTKSQHYVPRFLLKPFCRDGKHITVTDLKTGKTYPNNITNVAQENYFYELDTMQGNVSLEAQFAKSEGLAAPIIDKIIETESISWFSDNDYDILEDFILCLFYRTRKYINHVKNFLKTNNIALFDIIGADGNIRKTVYSHDEPVDDNLAKVMSYNFLNHIERDDTVRDALASMEWLLLKSPGTSTFITSDNPAILSNRANEGMKYPDSSGFDLPHSQIFLPISPKLMLYLSASATVYEAKTKLLKTLMAGRQVLISDIFRCSVTGEAFTCPAIMVNELNKAQRSNAERFIFGS